MRVLVLLQVESLAALKAQEPTVRRILGLPGVAGLSIRVPGRTLNPAPAVWNLETLDHAAAIADDFDAELQTRTMGGRWAPDHIIDDARNYILTWPGGDAQIKLPAGTEVPMCFTRTGAINQFWLDWCIRAQKRLVRWALPRENVIVQHGFWSGLTWAEIAVVDQMAVLPGFDYDTIEQFHLGLMESLHELWPRDVEFALSGHVDQGYRQIFGTLLAEAKTSSRYIINRNDIGSANLHPMRFESIQDPPRHGFQMYAMEPHYEWKQILDEADGLGLSDGADYLECYTGNFGTEATPSALVPEIERRYDSGGPAPVLLSHTTRVTVPTLPPAGVVEDDVEPPSVWDLPARAVDAIQQLYSPSVTGLATKVRNAKTYTDGLITGFGTRIPAKYLDNSLALLDQSLAIARDNDLAYRPRTMMGGHISDQAKQLMGSRFLFDGSGAMQGAKCPRPTDGIGNPNVVFLDYYRMHVHRVFEWCEINGVDLFNVPTVGMAYSELYYGPELQNDPKGWLAVHKMLVDIVAEEQRPGVTAGWGLSGHGPYFTAQVNDMGMQLARYIKQKMPARDQSEGQGNGWGPNGIWGQSSSSTEAQMDHYLNDTGLTPGAQAIQPWKTGSSGSMAMLTTTQFAAAFGQLNRIDARQLEVYLDTPATDTQKRMVPFLREYLAEELEVSA